MKKYLFGVAVIILCIACAVGLHKGYVPEEQHVVVPKMQDIEISPLPVTAKQISVKTPPSIVLTNGVIVEDTREKLVLGTEAYKHYQQERKQVRYEGADAMVTLHVVDQDGNDVTNADVSVRFCFHSQNRLVTGKTDEKGLFVAADRLTEDILYEVSKKGYYRTFSKFWFMKSDTRCLENGRWIPWNPTFQVTLKEIRNPIPMVAKKVETKLPKDVKSMGFDFLVGDWVEPHGKGITVDMLYVYEEDRTDKNNVDLKLTLAFPGSGNGCYMKRKDDFCALMSDHEARPDNYSSNIVSRVYKKNGAYVFEDQITENDYLVYRVRSTCVENGNVVSAHYGKIYGPLEAPRDLARIIVVTSYFNPTPNDRNLEFDGKNNLLKGLSSLEDVCTPLVR